MRIGCASGLVFDREGYSPGLFKRMDAKRIACQTYRKFVDDERPEEEFGTHRVKLILEGKIRKRAAKLARRKLKLYDLTLGKGIEPQAIEHHIREAEARTFAGKLYATEANLRPDPSAGILGVEIHNLATPKDNRILRELCGQFNETHYPGTNLRLVYKLVSD